MALVVDALGVFPQRQLHGGGGLTQHGIHPGPVGFQGGELAADGVGGAGAGHDRGDSGGAGLPKAAVQGIHRVDGPQVGGAGVGGLVAVVPLEAQGIPEHAQVAVCVDEAGQDVALVGVQDLPLPVAGALFHKADPPDLSLPDVHKAVGDVRRVDGVYGTVDNEHSSLLLDAVGCRTGRFDKTTKVTPVDVIVNIWYINLAAQPVYLVA